MPPLPRSGTFSLLDFMVFAQGEMSRFCNETDKLGAEFRGQRKREGAQSDPARPSPTARMSWRTGKTKLFVRMRRVTEPSAPRAPPFF